MNDSAAPSDAVVTAHCLDELSDSDRARIVRLLGEAFAAHPMIPPDPPGKPPNWGATLMMDTMLTVFSKAPDARILCIHRDEEPACVAFVHEYGYEPSKLDTIKLMWRMVRVLGIRLLASCMRVFATKHPGDDRRLELLILGTRAQCQGQGLGRAMLRDLYDYARRRGYVAVTLEAAKAPPAFDFYEREGFFVEKEVLFGDHTLCLMRRELN